MGAETANFFDDGEGKREAGAAAAHEEGGRDDEGQGHFQGELGALAACALDIDFAVEHIEIGADDVEADAAAGELGFCRSGGEAGMEEHFAEIALGEAVGRCGGGETPFTCPFPSPPPTLPPPAPL